MRCRRTPTADLTRAVLQLLALRGVEAWPVYGGAVYDPTRGVYRKNPQRRNGVPDINGYVRRGPRTGVAVYLELKRGRDRLSDEQERFIREAGAAGCIAGEVRALEDVERLLRDAGV